MIRSQLAYRHANGEVEGFVGYAFLADNAEQECVKRMQEKCAGIRAEFKWNNIIRTRKGLTPAELRKVRDDWKAIRKALKASGASIY